MNQRNGCFLFFFAMLKEFWSNELLFNSAVKQSPTLYSELIAALTDLYKNMAPEGAYSGTDRVAYITSWGDELLSSLSKSIPINGLTITEVFDSVPKHTRTNLFLKHLPHYNVTSAHDLVAHECDQRDSLIDFGKKLKELRSKLDCPDSSKRSQNSPR